MSTIPLPISFFGPVVRLRQILANCDQTTFIEVTIKEAENVSEEQRKGALEILRKLK